MKTIAIFCGSSKGSDSFYEEQAYLLGKVLAESGMGLVYGGAKIGLMGAVADGALQHGGRVVGVLPHFLQTKEIAHEGLTELILVDTMHERKMKMNALSDAVIALPGGFGTMEEFFEVLTWGQLGLHQKPMGLLNTNGFYNELIALAQQMVDQGFLRERNQRMMLWDTGIPGLLDKMRNYQPPATGKWITSETT